MIGLNFFSFKILSLSFFSCFLAYNLINNLKENAPTLSKKEIRLSAFIKMGLTNKEIAPLLNISTRGVETARYRLRKKLNLDQDDKLMEFFDSLA